MKPDLTLFVNWNWRNAADVLIWWAGIVTAAGAVAGAVVQIARFVRRVTVAIDRLSDQLDGVTTARIMQTIEDLLERMLVLEQWGDLLLTHAIKIAVWEIDADGKCRCVSRGLCHLAGASRDELLGLGWTNHIAPADRQRVLTHLRQAAAEQRDERIEAVTITNPLLRQSTVVSLIASPVRGGRSPVLLVMAVSNSK